MNDDLINEIYSYYTIYDITNTTSSILKEQANQIFKFVLLSKIFYTEINKKNLNVLKRLYYYINKYIYYQEDYIYNRAFHGIYYIENPILIDILFTGCDLPCVYSTYDILPFKVIEEDIKELLEINPNLIYSTFGTMRCRNNITPLTAACFNNYITTDIIELLLKHNANPNYEYLVNGEKITVLQDLENNIGSNNKRYIEIKRLFNKYANISNDSHN